MSSVLSVVRTIAVPLVVLALVVTAALTIFGGEERKTLTASFPRTVSVYEGSDVRVLGVPVGTVDSVTPSGTEVLVTEGKVEVWGKGGSAHRRLLVEGDRAFLAQNAGPISVSRQPVEVNRKLAWREGKVILKNQTLDDAVADFNRYSPKTIIIVDAALRDKRLFGQYKLDAPELFAQDVSTVLDVPVAITADTIFIGRRQGEAQDGI